MINPRPLLTINYGPYSPQTSTIKCNHKEEISVLKKFVETKTVGENIFTKFLPKVYLKPLENKYMGHANVEPITTLEHIEKYHVQIDK